MAAYTILDYLPGLTVEQMSGAETLVFLPYQYPYDTEWENEASVSDVETTATPQTIYRFEAKEGATYDVMPLSSLIPFNVLIYDNQGNAIQINGESEDYINDTYEREFIWDWVAPYSGTFYVGMKWLQEDPRHYYIVSIYEDIDTAVSDENTGPVTNTTLAETHLANYGITIQQANEFILSHVNDPSTIFNVAQQFSVTTLMLSEITGYSTSVISAYFASYGLDTEDLDGVDLPDDSDNTALASLTSYMTFNNNTGILSTDALRENIIISTSTDDYFSAFSPENFKGSEDGIFTPDELGTARLGNVPATTENIESLILGTFIQAFKSIDNSEIMQFGQITQLLQDPETNTKSPDFLALMDSVFSDLAASPIYTDSELASATIEFSIQIVENIVNANRTFAFDDILNLSGA